MGDFGGWIDRTFVPESTDWAVTSSSEKKARKATAENEANAEQTKKEQVAMKAAEDSASLAATKKAAEDKRRAANQYSYGATLGSQANISRKVLLGR